MSVGRAAAIESLSWFSFLRMARSELGVSFGAAMGAAMLLFAMQFFFDPPAWAFPLPAAAFIGASFWGWMASYRRLQAIEDVPLSRIATCAQGYARIEGRASVLPGQPLMGPVSRQQCCWYRFRVAKLNSKGEEVSSEVEETDWSFMMADGNAECVVDPVGAHIVAVREQGYRDTEQVMTERAIFPGDALFVLGEFRTSGASLSEYDIDLRTGQVLGEWKKDMAALWRRFPPAEGSAYTPPEWEQVRQAARQEVEAEIARQPAEGQNRVARPADGRPFVISAESADQLKRDLAVWSWLHAGAFVAGVGGLAWFVLRYF